MEPLVAAAIACAVAWASTPWLARRAGRLGLVDEPGVRKVHRTPTPRTGGLGLAAGILAGFVLLVATVDPDGGVLVVYGIPALGFFALGLLDDRRGIRARTKFVLQLALAGLAVFLGWRWAGVGFEPFGALTFGAATPWMSVLWIVAVVTVVNWIDGIDLITACTALVVLGTAAGARAGPLEGHVAFVLVGALLGVTFWNVPPAKVFLGDAGTHLLGFCIAVLPFHAPETRPFGPDLAVTPLPWVLASAPLLPAVLDIALGLVAKARRGVPLWQAHRQHLHHRLVASGQSHATVALRYAGLAAAAVLCVLYAYPPWGVVPASLLAAGILALHFLDVRRRTRDLPVEFPPDA